MSQHVTHVLCSVLVILLFLSELTQTTCSAVTCNPTATSSICVRVNYQYIANTTLNTCFIIAKYNSIRMTWYDARQICQDKGGDLVVLSTIHIDNLVKSWFGANGIIGQPAWIGLTNKMWKWNCTGMLNLDI